MADASLATAALSCVAEDTQGLTLQLEPGARWGLLGAPGSGKTLWLRTLTRLQPPWAGKLYWRGVDVTRRPAWRMGALRRWVALILANPAQVAEPWAPLRRLLPRDPSLAQAALKQVGLSPVVLTRRVEDLSLAQRVRLAAARALAAGTRVLLVDNVAARLWPEAWPELVADLDNAVGPEGVLLTASHRPADLESMTHWVVLAGGVPVELGHVEALRAAPCHPVTQALLAGREPQSVPVIYAPWEACAPDHWWRPPLR